MCYQLRCSHRCHKNRRASERHVGCALSQLFADCWDYASIEMQRPDEDDDLDLPRRKRPRAAAPLYYSETDVFRGADARAVDAALAALRRAATTVEDGPMRSVAIAPLAATAPGALAIYGALADAIEKSGAPRPRRLATCQLAIYEVGDHFNTWHVDETEDEGRVAIVVFLSEPTEYEGGEFDAEGDIVLPARPPARSFVVFDASRLRHRVRAVRRGRREALLCWTASAHDPAPAVAAPPPTRAAPTTVKVIVWDLDGTLWRGALEDDDRVEPRRALVDAIGALADRGIVSTVCSRAPRAAAEGMLATLGIRELLVFNEYDVAGSKGARVLRTLEAMHLSPRHALFVDDEASNRADVLSRCAGIGALAPDDLEALLPVAWGAPDDARERLARYKVLERKHEARQPEEEDDAFLRRCAVVATVSRVAASESDADRLVELLQRSNRLNYTKDDRPDATWDVLDVAAGAYDSYKDEPGERICWKVTVRDAFGEYGVVGVVAASRVDGGSWRPRACSTRWVSGNYWSSTSTTSWGPRARASSGRSRRCTCRRATRCSSTTRRATAPTFLAGARASERCLPMI